MGTALDMADSIIASTQGADGFFERLSELGRWSVPWRNHWPAGASELMKEAPIRNSAGLLTVRHHLFTILLAADSYSVGVGGEGGHPLSTSKAAAEVWRDPFRDTNGNHRCLIRLLKMLDD